MDLGLFYALGGFGGGPRRRKAKKPKKKKKENWFERLTVDQLKQLCKAATLRHVGKKNELIERLLENESTRKFGPEDRLSINYGCGYNVEGIKKLCRERNLQVSGSKFDLVLRVLHHDHDSTPEGTTLKRAATEITKVVDETTGEVKEVQVPKKRKKAAPSAARAYSRVQKKIESVRQKKYQSHWGSKTHSSEVYSLVGELMREAMNADGNYLERDPLALLKIAESACSSLAENWNTMQRVGYDDFGGWEDIGSCLNRIVKAATPKLSDEGKEDTASWIEALHDCAEPYGLTDGMDHNLQDIVASLRSGKVEEEEDDRKPAAKEDGHASTIEKENTENATVTA